MDLLRWGYFEEIGYDRHAANENFNAGGFWALYHYWKPFEAHAVKRMLEDFNECIFDFGGSQTVYESDELFEQVRGLLDPIKMNRYRYCMPAIPTHQKISGRLMNTLCGITRITILPSISYIRKVKRLKVQLPKSYSGLETTAGRTSLRNRTSINLPVSTIHAPVREPNPSRSWHEIWEIDTACVPHFP